MDSREILEGIKRGERRYIAKAIRSIEAADSNSTAIIRELFRDPKESVRIGVTGPGGSGKSTMINKLAQKFDSESYKVAVLAVDPSSKITGGSFLGDRVRMQQLTDAKIFVHSIPSGEATGALSLALRDDIRLLEYAGFNLIIIESVGAGQTETDIRGIADVVAVVFSPNTGDGIQVIKAGLTEIGDIYLANKSDLRGASQLYDSLKYHLSFSGKEVLSISTKSGKGIGELFDVLTKIISDKAPTTAERRKLQLESEIRDELFSLFKNRLDEKLSVPENYKEFQKILSESKDPRQAAGKILKCIKF
ncbi:MAG: ATP/GTP-binding protein [Candidatus Micrarchaeota archaeon]|nr:ATP/GTP-binding protein [Candidatus Micrarchaeota archaeon]